MSISSASSTIPYQSPSAVQQTARAAFARTGVDKDAGIGDPDQDAPRTKVAPARAPSGTAAASAVSTLNAIERAPDVTSAAAATAYTALQSS